MSFIRRAFSAATRNSNNDERRSALDVPGMLFNPGVIAEVLSGGTSANSSNEMVNDYTAQTVSHCYTAVKILCDTVSSIPIKLYKGAGTGEKQLDIAAPLYRILTAEWNPETSALTGLSTACRHLQLRGNAYAEIRRTPTGAVQSIWNLDPRRTEPVRLPLQNNALAYRTSDGQQQGEYRVIEAKSMLHWSINSWDAICGQSPVSCLRETLGLAISQSKMQARSMVNSAIPSLIVKTGGSLPLDPVSKTKAREDFERLNSGSSQRRVAILDPGFEVQPLGFSHVDLELLQARRFTMQEIASAYGVPAWMLGDTEKLTSASAIQLALAFIQNTIAPLAKLFTSEMQRKLIPANSPAHIAADLRERLKGDFASTLEALSVGRQNGFYSVNDCRRELGEDPIGPEGDVYTVQVNMTNLENMVKGKPALDGSLSQFDDEEDDDIDTPTLRNRYANMTAYQPLFRNAVTRSVNGESVASVFGPVLESMLGLRAGQISEDDATQLLADMLTKIEARAKRWQADNVEEIAAQELTRSVKSIVFGVHEIAAKRELAA